jgi:hypothetical protein
VPPLQNDLAAYQFDSCVMYVLLTIKNALNEREEYGPQDARQWRAKYSINQLLDPDFRLPHSTPGGTTIRGESQVGLKAMAAAYPGAVGRWKQAPQGEKAQ